MMKRQLKRRDFLRMSLAATAGGAVLVACAPRAAPAQPAAVATPVPKEEAPAPVKDRAVLRVVSWPGIRTFMEDAAIEFDQQRDDVDVEVEIWVYAEAVRKALAALATGTMPDQFYAHARWVKYLIYRGAALALDELIETTDPAQGFVDDWYHNGIESPSLEGKLYGIPFEFNAGGSALVFYNKNLLGEKGVDEPTDDWTTHDYLEIAAKLQDRPKKIFGTTFVPTSFHYWSSTARTFGSDALSEDGKQVLFATDPYNVEAARWVWSFRNEYDGGALRDEMEGLTFQVGRVALHNGAVQGIEAIMQAVGDRFEVGMVLFPKGPRGNRGYFNGVNNLLISSHTKHAPEAFDCLTYTLSREWQERAFVEQGNPPGRISVWEKAEQLGMDPIWNRVSDWMLSEKTPGHFPMPYNLRFEELNDKYLNMHHALWYGEVPFDEGIQNIHRELSTIVSLPRD